MGKWEDKLENIEHCKRIARMIDASFQGNVFKCPYCGNTEISPKGICKCGEMQDAEDWESAPLLDGVEIYDIEYRVGADLEFRSVELMIAGGGPSIYIDTSSHSVNLYWGTDEARYPLSLEVCEAIDEIFTAQYESRLSRRW